LAGTYGAARAAKLSGDAGSARRYYAELVQLTQHGDANRAEIKEARAVAAELAVR
jgi:hypothetical protein